MDARLQDNVFGKKATILFVSKQYSYLTLHFADLGKKIIAIQI